MAAKKRKETPQSSTLLDFFDNGPARSSQRQSKKPRVKDAVVCKQIDPKKVTVPPEDIIVIDSDEDDAVPPTPSRPAVRPSQAPVTGITASSSSHQVKEANLVFVDISAPACRLTNTVGSDAQIEVPIVKSESAADGPDACSGHSSPASFHETLEHERDPSPFGYPDILVPRGTETESAVPPQCPRIALPDCSHDGKADSKPSPGVFSPHERDVGEVEGALLEEADWDMGDDEFGDIETKVKVEESGEVDIDLTLEEDEPLEAEKDTVESCPICEQQLIGMTTLQIHEHVDGCIDALPEPPRTVSTSSSASSSKTLRPLSALLSPQPPVSDANASANATVKQESGDCNIFSTLMTSYKENEAWKEASSVEDRNFRPTKANGGRRKAPFYKVLQGMPIAVDAFRYGAIPNVTAYFLTHAHSDHYTNLSSNWKGGPIYCSQGTANLIIHMLSVDPKWVHPLPMDVPTTIPNTGGVQVTLIEANHCPGSCLFLFEGKQTVNAGDSAYKSPFVGSAKAFRYLHCGDFRACPQHVLHPAIKGKHIDHVYLDTTYLDPKYCFPPQPLVISACADLAKRLVQGSAVEDVDEATNKPRTMAGWFTRQPKAEKGKEKPQEAPCSVLVVVGTYSIGKERIVKAVAKALNTKVYCDSRKAAILRCENDPELDDMLTSDPFVAGVHLVPLGVIASDRLKQYAERWKGRYSKVIGFRPTGWTFSAPKGSDTLPSIPTVISRSQSRTFTHANLQPMRNSTAALQVYGVPYSEHSSFFELTCFALSFSWTRMIATVNVGSEASRGKMAKWVERWEAERKKRGGVKMVEHRAADYW